MLARFATRLWWDTSNKSTERADLFFLCKVGRAGILRLCSGQAARRSTGLRDEIGIGFGELTAEKIGPALDFKSRPEVGSRFGYCLPMILPLMSTLSSTTMLAPVSGPPSITR